MELSINRKYSAGVSFNSHSLLQSVSLILRDLVLIDYYYSIERLPEVEDGGYLLNPFVSPDPLNIHGVSIDNHDKPHHMFGTSTIEGFIKAKEELSNQKNAKDLVEIIDTVISLSSLYNDMYNKELRDPLSYALKVAKDTGDKSGVLLIKAKPFNDIYNKIASCIEDLVDDV